ncbi:hypothetical protein HY477_00695 [Candidatus Uhrbacteria bacterium]|nr:hypothetical protein [Candidatus Uhrbacteria bacterium]
MTIRSFLYTLIAALMLTATLPACGGGDDGESNPQEGEGEGEEGEAEAEGEEGAHAAYLNATFTYDGEEYELNFSNRLEDCEICKSECGGGDTTCIIALLDTDGSELTIGGSYRPGGDRFPAYSCSIQGPFPGVGMDCNSTEENGWGLCGASIENPQYSENCGVVGEAAEQKAGCDCPFWYQSSNASEFNGNVTLLEEDGSGGWHVAFHAEQICLYGELTPEVGGDDHGCLGPATGVLDGRAFLPIQVRH